MPANVTDWVSVKDFSPGIRARVTPANSRSLRGEPLGIANAEGTYRCQAMADRSLGPLVGRSDEIHLTLPGSTSGLQNGQFAISGFWQSGPVGLGDYEFHIAWGWRGGSTLNWRWERIRTWDGNAVDVLGARSWDGGLVVFLDDIHINPTWITNHRSASSDWHDSGLPQIAVAFQALDQANSIWAFWPNAATPGDMTPLIVGSPYWPSIGVSHQLHHMILDHRPDPHGVGPAWNHNEDIYYTNYNLQTVANPGKPVTFGCENTTGYSAAVSTSYGELLLLKAQFGGLLIRGSITDPTALRLPAIPDLGLGTHQAPAVTPLGVVFLTYSSGAWLWAGGEAVEHISGDAVNGEDFVIPYVVGTNYGDREISGFLGRMWCWHEYVFFPNNWVWNWKQQNWWRLEDPADIKYLWCGPDMTLHENACYFAPSAVRPGQPAIYEYKWNTPAKNYVWTSQPLPVQENRQFKVREVVFVLSGACDWTFELFNLDGTIETHSFATTRLDRPEYIRQNANVTAEELKFRITSDSTTSAGIVHEVRFGIQTDVHYPNNA